MPYRASFSICHDVLPGRTSRSAHGVAGRFSVLPCGASRPRLQCASTVARVSGRPQLGNTVAQRSGIQVAAVIANSDNLTLASEMGVGIVRMDLS